MTDKVIKRGYVKWTDASGVFHKEPLYKHPDLLAKASPEEQLAAEEARRLNEAAEEYQENAEAVADADIKKALADLKKAPDDVLTAAQLEEPVSPVVPVAPVSGAEEPAYGRDDD